MRATASILRWTASAAGTVQGGVQGGVGVALGIDNIDLAQITKAVDSLLAQTDFFDSQMQQLIEAINQNYNDMAAEIRRIGRQVDSIPTIQIA
jgi:hypothetical protein